MHSFYLHCSKFSEWFLEIVVFEVGTKVEEVDHTTRIDHWTRFTSASDSGIATTELYG
jgi:hypothetical protein